MIAQREKNIETWRWITVPSILPVCCQSTTDKSLYWYLPTTTMEHTLSNTRNFDVIQFFKKISYFLLVFCQRKSMSQFIILNAPTALLCRFVLTGFKVLQKIHSRFLMKGDSKIVINKDLGLLFYTVWMIRLKTQKHG